MSVGIKKVWEHWANPEHIVNWNFASPEWHCPTAEHELKIGGILKYHMAAIDGSISFDYTGTFEQIKTNELLEYVHR
ncbi:SRPBCC domain-containing protein [Xanthovirga aplysinae]|uniref:SRPBCC domain-containing protein n=1 Tax=Xanthovirga aplysinae TaxID=2529853 RepID=UPI0031B5C773